MVIRVVIIQYLCVLSTQNYSEQFPIQIMSKYYLSPSKDQARSKKLAAFDRLLTIMDELREQCPWDRKQTFDSLRYLTLEEVYELSDAIISKNYNELEKELGDILLHIVFYAKIG